MRTFIAVVEGLSVESEPSTRVDLVFPDSDLTNALFDQLALDAVRSTVHVSID
jgi:hypothetical protein